MLDGKTGVVAKWFEQRLNGKTGQLANLNYARKHNKLAEPSYNEAWYKRIDTDVLFDDFTVWLHENYVKAFVDHLELSKSGFMLIFYRLTGAVRTRTRFGQNRKSTSYVASFESREYHRAWYERYVTEAQDVA